METLLQCLATHLGQSSDPDLILRICKLIRFSPKDFDGVDVVLPPLQVLKKCLEGEELNVKNYEALLGTELANLALLNDAVSCEWRFSDISVKSEKILLRLDRSFVLSQQMKRLALEGHRFEARPDRRRVRIVNCELSLSSGCQTSVYSQLAEVRCNQVCQLLRRIYKTCGSEILSGSDPSSPDFAVNVGCADPKYLKTEASDSVLKVGPIIDAGTRKKDFSRLLVDVFFELSANFRDISLERQVGNATVRTTDVRKAAAAELQFQMLSCNVGQAICLTTECQNSDASFVLYNFARISQIIATFQKGHFRLNKICQTATGLAKAFSRYYNRVRVLREPLPHLLPAVFARLTFLSVIKRTFEQLFHLLDIVPISKM